MSVKNNIIKIFLIAIIIKSFNCHNDEKVSDTDLNKAVSCLHVLSKKFDYEIDRKVYSSTMLACFTSITELDAKEILVAVQQEMKFLSQEEIDKLCDVNNLKKLDKQTIYIESKKLQNALKEFDNMREKQRKNEKYAPNDIDNENEEYKKAHPSRGNKLGRFMKGMTNLLKLFNNFGKIIIVIIALYLIYFFWNNCKNKNSYVPKYEDYTKIVKYIKKNKKKKN